MDQETVAWLASEAGRTVISSATAYDDETHARAAAGDATAVDPLRAATALRRAHPDCPPSLTAAALTQVRLRRRTRLRLGGIVDHLLLTDDGAEQATRTVVADLRALRYARSGATHVADLGCGLGLDSIAFARAGLRVTAIERDPTTAALAEANAAALGLAELITVMTGDVTSAAVLDPVLARVDAAFVDPARRDPTITNAGRSARVTNLESWSPPWSWVESIAALVPRTAAKVAPGVPHEITPHGGRALWTSVDGQLVEAEIAWPALVADGVRREAVIVRGADVSTMRSVTDLAAQEEPRTGPVGRWLLEPDDAVIRAGLVADLAHLLDGRLLDPRVAYVTTDADHDAGALATRFTVAYALPFTVTALRERLVREGVGRVVVKKRAIAADPDDVRRSLALSPAPRSAVVLLTRIGPDPWAFVCDLR